MARTSAQQKLGIKVHDYRKAAGYTQEQLEELTGLDRSYISGVERGARNPSIKNITKLAKALKVKVSDLVDF
jgi:transcriptional regulator with XRE-family HTH domain